MVTGFFYFVIAWAIMLVPVGFARAAGEVAIRAVKIVAAVKVRGKFMVVYC